MVNGWAYRQGRRKWDVNRLCLDMLSVVIARLYALFIHRYIISGVAGVGQGQAMKVSRRQDGLSFRQGATSWRRLQGLSYHQGRQGRASGDGWASSSGRAGTGTQADT